MFRRYLYYIAAFSSCYPTAQAQSSATILTAGRSLFLQDSHKVVTNYTGDSPMARSFGSSQSRPLTLVTADFDEDGMPDLASGYATRDGSGAVTIHRGNIDALWPYGAALRNGEPPVFLPEARVFALPEAPDFLGAGDFDADGHWDLVAGHLGSKALYFLRADGHGGFAKAERIELPGALTALTTGEINRVDGLTDIAVGITAGSGAQVLVFESPAGALRSKPERFPVPNAATALAMLPLDDGHFNGLAVGAGNQLITILGRDRKLSHPQAVRATVPAAEVRRQRLPFAIRSLAAGRFTSAAPNLLDIALLGDDGRVHFLARRDAEYQEALAELPVSMSRPNGLPAPMRTGKRDSRSLPKRPETRDLELRDEIAMPSVLDAAARLVTAHTSITGVDDVIVVDTAASRLHVISRNPAAQSMRLAASLDAAAAPTAVLPMRMNPSALHGLVVLQTDQVEPSVVRPHVQFSFTVTNTLDSGPGVGTTLSTATPGSLRTAITNATNAGGTSTITFNIPVTDPNYNPNDGTFTITPLPTTNCGGTGVVAVPCQGLPPLPPGSVLDGYTQPGASPNTLANGDNAVIKIHISGASANTGPSGIWLFNGNSTVRGIVATGFRAATVNGGQNTNGGYGVEADSGGNVVEGNFLGTNAAGTAVIPNYIGAGGFGGGNIIGGTTPQARNLMSGNSFANFGSAVNSAPNTYLVQRNYIGTDHTGTLALGGTGFSNNGVAMVVGGTTAGAGNLISGNTQSAIGFSFVAGNPFTPDSNIVQGNLVGTDVTGKLALGNGSGIVVQTGSFNQIGGTTPAARNVVSGNFSGGIEVDNGALQTNVQGNFIGVDISGSHALQNSGDGIYHATTGTLPPAVGTLIGGDAPGAGNVISGNATFGIEFGSAVQEQGVIGESVFGNLIGTDATGLHALGNGLGGIIIDQGGGYVTIGGADVGAANVIAYNGEQGILINPAANNPNPNLAVGPNPVTGNSIFSNAAAGVAVLSGSDNQISQNSIYANGGLGIDIGASGPNSCQASANGPNKLQNAPVLTPASGGVTLVTATATDPNGNTSEFSNCAAMSNTGNVLNIAGQLNSLPNTAYSIELFQNAACGSSAQGQTFLNRISITTGANCIANFGGSVNIATADLSLALTGPGTTQYGSNFTYRAVVTNNGGASASGVSFTDTLPASEAIVSVSPSVGTCGTAGNAVTCSLGTIPNGATATVSIVVTVNAAGVIADTASVTGSTADPDSANNTAALNITSTYGYVILDHVNPPTGVAGIGAFPLIVTGVFFYPGVTTVTANGTPVSFTVSNDQTCEGAPCEGLHLTLPTTLTAATGTVNISVTNPTPGGGSDSLNFTLYTNPGTVTKFQVSGIPSASLVGTPYNMTVTALDAGAHTVSGYRGTVNLAGELGIETFNPASPYTFTTADNGTHTFSVLFTESFPFVESITVSDAAIPVIMGSLATTVGDTPGPPTIITPAATPGNVPIGYPFPQAFSVVLLDANFNNVPGVTVTFTAPSSGASGTFSNGQTSIQVVTDTTGTAQAQLTANQTAGQFTVTASAAGGSLTASWTPTSTTHVPAHLIVISGSPQTGPINTQFSPLVQVQVTDAQNNGVPNILVTFTAPTTGPSAYFPTPTFLTQSGSQAGVALLEGPVVANATTGSYAITAAAGSLQANIMFTNTAVSDPVASFFPQGSGQSAVVNTAFAVKLGVSPVDANGNCLAKVPVTFSVPASGPSVTLSANPVTSDYTCAALVTATANGIKGGPYNVTATMPGGLSTTFVLTNLATTTTTLTATGGTPQAAGPGAAFASPVQVTVLDANGNPLASQIVNFSAPAGGATAALSGSTVLTNSSGVAQVNATANGVAGAYSVTANYGPLQAVFSLTNQAPFSLCDINQDGVTNVSDVQIIINEALGTKAAANDLNGDGAVNVSDVQIVINAALGLGCTAK